ITRVALRSPAPAGVKRTSIVQLCPAETVAFAQALFATAKSPGLAPPTVAELTSNGGPPGLRTCTGRVAGAPTVCCPTATPSSAVIAAVGFQSWLLAREAKFGPTPPTTSA